MSRRLTTASPLDTCTIYTVFPSLGEHTRRLQQRQFKEDELSVESCRVILFVRLSNNLFASNTFIFSVLIFSLSRFFTRGKLWRHCVAFSKQGRRLGRSPAGHIQGGKLMQWQWRRRRGVTGKKKQQCEARRSLLSLASLRLTGDTEGS